MAQESSIKYSNRQIIGICVKWGQTIAGYLVIGIIGSMIITLIASYFKAVVAQKAVDRADVLLFTNQPGEALDTMLPVEPWALPYPSLEYRLACIAIRCHVKLGDCDAAYKVAQGLADRYGIKNASPGLVQKLRNMEHGIVNASIANPNLGVPLTEWCGFDVLATELKGLGGHDDLVRRIEKERPSQTPVLIARNTASPPIELPPQPDVNHTASEASGETTNVIDVSEYSPEISHYDLALRHIGRQKWDQALRECELALSATPRDYYRIASLKNLAAGRGKGWGVVLNGNVKARAGAGAALACRLEAGTLVDILEVRSGEGDALAFGNATGEGASFPNVLIPLRDLEICAGSLAGAKEQLKKLKVQHAQLSAELDAAKQTLTEKRDESNPSAKEYAAAKTRYDEFWARDKSLKAKADAARDDLRMKCLDELRKMKLQEPPIMRAYDVARKKYKEWEDAHPADPEDTARIASLESNVAKVQNQAYQIEQGQ
jgi:hypothetical protein